MSPCQRDTSWSSGLPGRCGLLGLIDLFEFSSLPDPYVSSGHLGPSSRQACSIRLGIQACSICLCRQVSLIRLNRLTSPACHGSGLPGPI